ncbi:cap-specific mRNA (nucleoside-2'-O-)-methyltransferase 2-like [Anneissia japonica]|uniref:cap-specific mRNA (nucleoside-2'-O-)-methyltransferase 2-like n=1 Tax=Anneissia japonica TaxID=1529436 RepID=UPI001425A4B0|nr:cap-specific mRNA (nucleoside-2'-O-)-methyltransferase 2-like [Anneissia japonica]XP_033120883.1 cap-specific mRNA (nucleoside-2'-O-)-methyltransferase 2-like [Anneissia japonica]
MVDVKYNSRSEPFHYRHHKNKAKRRRYNHHPSPSKLFTDHVKSTASDQFEKRFSFPEESSWILPEPSTMFVEGQAQDIKSDLHQMKIELNDVKNSLSDKEIRQWHSHTTSLHCGGKTIQHLRWHYCVELCTQAWCKFHEILTFYPIIPTTAQTSGTLNSVHLCEAPGAFITSLNHFCKSRADYTYLQWRWIGATLNPYYEGNSLNNMIADDRFIQETRPNWFFGVDDSGDLMSRENLEGLHTHAQLKGMEEIHLVTADGSINCQNDPGEQETFVSQLHYCEMITALYLLAEGGSFVIKMFTMFEISTANMMFLLNCSFEEVHVFKPSTSKAGNSEVYVICLNYKGRNRLDQYFPVLLQAFGPTPADSPMFPSLPPSFLSKLTECCNFFKSRQMEAIQNNLRLFNNMTEEDCQHAEDIRDCCTEMFVEKCRIQIIQRKHKMLKNNISNSGFKPGMYCKTLEQRLHGTFNERVQKQQLSWHQRILGMKQEISALEEKLLYEPTVSVLENTSKLSEKDVDGWKPTLGKKVQQLLNSPFCSCLVVGHWIEAHANSKVTEPGTSEDLVVTPEIESHIKSSLKSLPWISKDSPLKYKLLSAASEMRPIVNILKDNGCILVSDSEVKEMEDEEERAEDDDGNNDLKQPQEDYQPRVHVVCSFAGLQSQNTYESTKGELLSSILTALKSLSIGGCVILQVHNLLTRFNAGLLYILYKAFRTVYLCDLSTKSGLNSTCLLICQSYNGCHGNLITYLENILENIHETMLSAIEPDQAVLQILPMSRLYECEFEKVLTHFNETSLTRQVVAIVNCEMTDDADDSRFSSR